MQILGSVAVACALFMGNGVAQQQVNTIAMNINQIPELSRLSSIMQMTEMQPLLREMVGGQFTFFAPSNAAIEAATFDVNNWQLWNQYLRYHLVPTYLTTSVMGGVSFPATLLESPQFVRLAPGRPMGQVLEVFRAPSGQYTIQFGLQRADIVRANILSADGIMHIVDRIFVPPVSPSQTFGSSEIFSRWMDIIRRSGMTTTVDRLEGISMFVPSNEAIAALDRLNLSTEQYATIIRYHVVPSLQYSTTLRDNMILPTLQGESVQIDIQGNRLFVNNAEVIDPNILTANGVVHRINKVLLPPSLRTALHLE
jgi:uncharacterized surface protein with fasciclin (FAS1) repeats